MTGVDFTPTPDGLLRNPVLTHTQCIPVLGIDTRFETNSAYVLALIAETFGGWRVRDEDAEHAVCVRIVVHEGRDDAAQPTRHISTADGRLLVHTAGSIAVVDPARRESVAYVTTELARDRVRFQGSVLEAITFALLAPFDRHPVHAAGIVRDDRVVLLAGPSGAGKSTLACLAHRAGLHVLSDDRVWVQCRPKLRVWGSATSVALPPSAAAHIADATSGASRHDGKHIVSLEPREPARAPFAERATVCILARGPRALLTRLDAAEAARELTAQLAPGFDRFPERQADVLAALTAHGGWRLALSADPRDALPLLTEMLDDA